jgi:hypothetical protein
MQPRHRTVAATAPAPPAHPETDPAPWIDRLVSSPAVRSGYTSLAVHLLALILLAMFMLDVKSPRQPRPLVLSIGPESDRSAIAADSPGPVMVALDDHDSATAAEPADPVAAEPVPEPDQMPPATLDDPPPLAAMADGPAEEAAAPGDADGQDAGAAPIVQAISSKGPQPRLPRGARPVAGRPGTGDAAGGGLGFAARKGDARTAAARRRGGTADSEAAVERGLEWLALHQAVDGSWQFDLAGCRCDGACRNPGTLHSSTASTAIAVLPFLGAGHTHLEGRHQETVSRAIYYLLSRMTSTPRGGDFCEGTMYGHGVTTLALAEALGMTKDELLVRPVREAVRFIETAQDLHSGGWRYLPGQSGDITVTAWQVAALKSAQLAGVGAPSPTMEGVKRFLDGVQSNNGTAYGYRTPAAKPCTSAIGLLCRMYLGWGPEDEPLYRGVTTLAKTGPVPDAVYLNFYLSQTLLQMNHPVWPRWNAKNRQQLVARQARVAHETGSWFFADHDTAPGGRLAHTCLAILTLEVYYRLLPIYQQEAVETEF